MTVSTLTMIFWTNWILLPSHGYAATFCLPGFCFVVNFRLSWLWLTWWGHFVSNVLNTIAYFQLSTWATTFPHEELSICCFLEWSEPSGQHSDHLLTLTHTWQYLFWCNLSGILPGFERLNVFFYASAHLSSFCYNKYATLFWHIYMVLCLNPKIVEMGNLILLQCALYFL